MKISIILSALIVVFGILNIIVALYVDNYDAALGWSIAVLQAGCNIFANLTILNNKSR